MFDAIAHSYDLMNRLMTMGQDGRWRRYAADAARLKPGDRALDVATGTGDLARELAHRVMPIGDVVAMDIAEGMMEIGRRKLMNLPVTFQHGDVHTAGFDAEFDAATVAFGLRNFADRAAAIGSMVAALKPGGRLVVLELVPAAGPLQPLVRLYEQRLIPILGGLVSGNRRAYTYLPKSVAVSLTREQIEELLRSSGLVDVGSRTLGLGTVAIVWGAKAQ